MNGHRAVSGYFGVPGETSTGATEGIDHFVIILYDNYGFKIFCFCKSNFI